MPRQLVVVALLFAIAGCADDATTSAPSVTAVLDEENIAQAEVTPVWTDDGVFVYGTVGPEEPPGRQAGAVALVDPDTGAVTPLPTPPFNHPLSRDPEVAVVGDHLFIMGSECDEVVVGEDSSFCVPGTVVAAVWSLSDETWTRVDVPDTIQSFASTVTGERGRLEPVTQLLGVTSDGLVVLNIIPEGQQTAGQAPFWTYSPEDDEWVNLADPGVVTYGSCLADDRLVAVTAEGDNTFTDVSLQVLPLNPVGSWVAGSPLPGVELGLSPSVECGDTFAVVFGMPELTPANAGSQALFEAFRQSVVDVTTSDWDELPPLPPEFLVGPTRWTGEDLLVLDFQSGDGITLTPDGNAWQPVSLPHDRAGIRRVWNGEEFVVIPAGS